MQQALGLKPRDKCADPQQELMKALSKTSAPSQPPKKKGGPCDKCDGPHHADDCPHFKGKARDKHKDAWDRRGNKGVVGSVSSGPVVLRQARIVPQPGDGSCLFHSLSYGLRNTSATQLRAEVADFIAGNPNAEVAGNPLKDWVLWDSGMDVKAYASTMRTGARWGGAVEIAICAQIKRVAVHIYEQGGGGFARISTFGSDDSGQIVNVHYGGRVHYDALQLMEPLEALKPRTGAVMAEPRTAVEPMEALELSEPRTAVELTEPRTAAELAEPRTAAELAKPRTAVEPMEALELTEPRTAVELTELRKHDTAVESLELLETAGDEDLRTPPVGSLFLAS